MQFDQHIGDAIPENYPHNFYHAFDKHVSFVLEQNVIRQYISPEAKTSKKIKPNPQPEIKPTNKNCSVTIKHYEDQFNLTPEYKAKLALYLEDRKKPISERIYV